MSTLTDFLPDAICIVDASGNIKQSNIQYRKRFFSCPSESKRVSGNTVPDNNFVNDVLHAEHQHRFFEALQILTSERLVGDNIDGVSLRYCICYTKGSHKLLPIKRLIHWTLNVTSNVDVFVAVGRSDDVGVVSCHQSNGFPCIIDEPPLAVTSEMDSLVSDDSLTDVVLAIGRPLLSYLSTAPVPITFLTAAGVVLWANDLNLSLLGRNRAEYIGHDLAEFLYAGEDGRFLNVISRVSAGDTVRGAHLKFVLKGDQVKYVLLDCNAVFTTRGELLYARCYMHPDTYHDTKARIVQDNEVLARKHTESRAEFVRNVFHEIRTPMHVLCNFFCDENPSREDFEEMKHQTGAILGIVDDLSFSTSFETKDVPSSENITQHLPSILAETFDAVKSTEQKAGGSVEIRLQYANLNPNIEEIIIDPYFKRVLYCLLSNAVKYSPLNGFVDVTISNTSAAALSRNYTKNNTAYSSGISTPQRPLPKDSFMSTLPVLCEKLEEKFLTSTGYFTFHIRNSTVTPMNVTETIAFFKSYYHSTTRGNRSCNQPSINSIVERLSSGNLLELALTDKSESPPCVMVPDSHKFHDLQQYSGLGLGLYTAYNMVSLMGGTLECSSENENEACFWFTIPAQYHTPDNRSPGLNDGVIESEREKTGTECKHSSSDDILRVIPSNEAITAALIGGNIDLEVTATRDLFLKSHTSNPTPSFARLSSTPAATTISSWTCPHDDLHLQSDSGRTSGGDYSEFPKQRILIVDDSRICQKVAGKALSGLEFVIDFASNGLEACVKLSEKPLRYDAVLMDLRMPVMDGLTAIRKCRTELRLTKLPIIALTAEVGASIKEEAIKAGASWFLTKPAKVLELICVMRVFSFSK